MIHRVRVIFKNFIKKKIIAKEAFLYPIQLLIKALKAAPKFKIKSRKSYGLEMKLRFLSCCLHICVKTPEFEARIFYYYYNFFLFISDFYAAK